MLIKARAQAKLPTTKYGNFACTAYKIGGHDYACVTCGDVTTGNPFVRIQSGCVYATVFHSADCDCRQEIDDALRVIAGAQHGVFVYAPHKEGRGVDLVTKTLAMANRQETGCDSAEDLSAIGLESNDFRGYDEEVAILRDLQVSRQIRLLSCNDGKRQAVEKGGFTVTQEYCFAKPSHTWQPSTASA
ncbi:hypothetical protein HY971_04640 [Candidatus Kaiserbacteria bacterium]|nr:hypothetical protein [Candidatus Kaiserbacteria bacterium]